MCIFMENSHKLWGSIDVTNHPKQANRYVCCIRCICCICCVCCVCCLGVGWFGREESFLLHLKVISSIITASVVSFLAAPTALRLQVQHCTSLLLLLLLLQLVQHVVLMQPHSLLIL